MKKFQKMMKIYILTKVEKWHGQFVKELDYPILSFSKIELRSILVSQYQQRVFNENYTSVKLENDSFTYTNKNNEERQYLIRKCKDVSFWKLLLNLIKNGIKYKRRIIQNYINSYRTSKKV